MSEIPSSRSTLYAPLYVITAAVLWGTTGVAVKLSNVADTSPLMPAAARNLLATTLIGVYLLQIDRRALCIKPKDICSMALLGVVGVGLCQLSYIFTVTQAYVGVAVLLQSLAPTFAYAWALIKHSEKFSKQKLSALALALGGGATVVLGQGGWGGAISPTGLVSGVISGLCWAFYSIYAKSLMHAYSSWTLLFWGNAFASLAWLFILPPQSLIGWCITKPNALVASLYLAVACTAIPSWFYLKGMRTLTPSTAGIIGAFEPVAATLLAYLVLHETLALTQIIGGFVIIVALILLQCTTVRREAITEPSAVITA